MRTLVSHDMVDDYLLSPEGMKNLAATCMLIEAIGESVKITTEIPMGICCLFDRKYLGNE